MEHEPLTHAERLEAVRRMEQRGVTRDTIAKRLRLSGATLKTLLLSASRSTECTAWDGPVDNSMGECADGENPAHAGDPTSSQRSQQSKEVT